MEHASGRPRKAQIQRLMMDFLQIGAYAVFTIASLAVRLHMPPSRLWISTICLNFQPLPLTCRLVIVLRLHLAVVVYSPLLETKLRTLAMMDQQRPKPWPTQQRPTAATAVPLDRHFAFGATVLRCDIRKSCSFSQSSSAISGSTLLTRQRCALPSLAVRLPPCARAFRCLPASRLHSFTQRSRRSHLLR